MEQRAIYNFGVLIFCLVCLCLGLIGASILIVTAYFDAAKYTGLLSLLSSLGSLLGGVAGTIAAVSAYLGVDAWKKQLKYGKHISLIWSCMESLRNFQRRNMQWYILAYAHGTSQLKSTETLDVEKKLLDAALEELSSHFSALDKIVVKNQWQWTNYAGNLSGNISSLVRTFREYKEEPYGITPLTQELTEINTLLKNNTEFLETELDKLESQYQ
tara:strand:+ start:52 stop:696 length:645 start_codon:yes stop_codon:yes gene_type:complete